MAIKVRCRQCRKKISIDEAFAGGVCRCPYCKAITMVPRAGGVSHVARPGRPDMPVPAGVEAQQVKAEKAVPLAKPVLIQGIVALILSGFLVLLLVLGVILVPRLRSGPAKPAPPGPGPNDQVSETVTTTDNDWTEAPSPVNPFTVKGIQVAGMAITPPVVYVLDASSGMRELFDVAVAVARYSIRTMAANNKFNVIIVCEEGVKNLSDGWVAGGADGDAMMKDTMMTYQPAGATDLAAGVRQAIAWKPNTVVVLSNKAVLDADALAENARKSGIKVFAVSLGGYHDVVKVMKNLAQQTGGQYRQFTGEALIEWLAEVPPLP